MISAEKYKHKGYVITGPEERLLRAAKVKRYQDKATGDAFIGQLPNLRNENMIIIGFMPISSLAELSALYKQCTRIHLDETVQQKFTQAEQRVGTVISAEGNGVYILLGQINGIKTSFDKNTIKKTLTFFVQNLNTVDSVLT
ncbi:hypothetical protein IT418_00140 [bacterium]|nr:hypothetical protein [bacterium]